MRVSHYFIVCVYECDLWMLCCVSGRVSCYCVVLWRSVCRALCSSVCLFVALCRHVIQVCAGMVGVL